MERHIPGLSELKHRTLFWRALGVEKPSIRQLLTDVRDVVLPGTFEAPRFVLQKGAELGYHCHVYKTIGNEDMGLMITMVGDEVFIEPHRSGKVRRPCDINGIGEKEKADLISQSQHYLGDTPQEARRRPGKRAMLLELQVK